MPALSQPAAISPPLSSVFSAASGVIAAVIGGRNLDGELAKVPSPLRPAVQDVAYGALRQFGRGDALLAPLLVKPLTEPRVRSLLLAAVYRLEERPTDAHTTVAQAVAAAENMANGRFKPLVNAVLRNFQRQRTTLVDKALVHDYARWQHPQWWIEKLAQSHPGEWQNILAAGNGRPPMTLRINRRRINRIEDYIARLSQAGISARALGGNAILVERPVAVSRLPGFADGHVSIQDWGAQQAAQLLDVHDGMRVLDACAAPGGKTTHLLELADIDLTALDSDAKRLDRVAENLERLGFSANLRTADCAAIDTWWDRQPFDRILADVPCSASGVVRRHPDMKWLRRKADVAGFARQQSRILDALWQVIAPGGKMLYCTCSLFQEENRQQIESFVSRHADARRRPTGGMDDELQLIPDDEHDGFYYALIEKNA